MSPFRTILFLLLAIIPFPVSAAMVEANVSSHFLTRGEQAVLEVVIKGTNDISDVSPAIPDIAGLQIRSVGFGAQPRFAPGRRIDYVFSYMISSYQEGRYKVPAIEVPLASGTVRTQPFEIEVFDEMALEWSTARIGDEQVRYAAAFRATKPSPYVGEKVPVEIKLYFPVTQRVEDWGIPDFEREGLSAWRFQPQPRVGRATLLGRTYTTVSYPSTLSANRTGAVRIGPASLRLQTVQFDPSNFGQAYFEAANLDIPALALEAKELPGGAPEGFDNAIGQFDLDVRSSETEVREGDPVSLEITVSGRGNLDTILPPKPLDEDGWKLYDASTSERGEERREMYGSVVFRQFMRPLRVQSMIPPFRLVYFDPDAGRYETLVSTPIQLTVLPSTAAPVAQIAAPQALPMPVEEMTDILGILPGTPALLSGRMTLPAWSWQILPGLLALGLLFRIVKNHLAPKLQRHPDAIARAKELREVEKTDGGRTAFYRAAGHFVERWFGQMPEPQALEILRKRDEICFRPENAGEPVSRAERQQVLRALRRLVVPLVAMALVFSSGRGHASSEAEEAFKEARYAEAAKLWLETGPYERLPADTLFNIGNAAYRLGSPGEAALYYRRALERQPTHAEARQNLRFLERKFGSITVKRPDYQHVLARLPLPLWQGMLWGGVWFVALGLLTFAATRPGAGVRAAAITALVTGPLVAAAGFTACHYYPDDARFAPPREQVVVVSDQASVRTDAARNAPKVIDAPAGSLCRLLNRTGEWAYVAFTNESRGWIPVSDIEPLIPENAPAPPKLRPREASENNA